jgi:hypothetical protein
MALGLRRWAGCLVLLMAATLAWGCGGKGANAAQEHRLDIDADPLALLPGSAVVVAKLDARAIADSGAVGNEIAGMAEKLLPVAEEAGFRPSRDVDRVTVANYATGGVDFAAVLSGRFDVAKISAAVRATDGRAIVPGVYGGRTTYTAGAVQYVVLTSRTVVSGTAEAVRRVIDRIQSGPLQRAMAPWVAETLETKDADVAVVADLQSQPVMVAGGAVGAMALGWAKGLRVARIIANFEPPGMNVAATLTYGDPAQAQGAVDGVRFVDGWLTVLGPALGSVRLQNLQVFADTNDVRCKFAVDDRTLRALLALVPRLLANSATSP